MIEDILYNMSAELFLLVLFSSSIIFALIFIFSVCWIVDYSMDSYWAERYVHSCGHVESWSLNTVLCRKCGKKGVWVRKLTKRKFFGGWKIE